MDGDNEKHNFYAHILYHKESPKIPDASLANHRRRELFLRLEFLNGFRAHQHSLLILSNLTQILDKF